MKYRIFCEPRPWPRTAGSGSRRYSPQWYRCLKADIRSQIARQPRVIRYSKAWIRVYITVYVRRPARTRLEYPSMGDVDNFAKVVLDACQRDRGDHDSTRYWLFDDDRFVQALYVNKLWSDEVNEPGYVIELESL